MIRYPYTGRGVDGFDEPGRRLAPALLVEMYRRMLRIRRIEEEIERQYHKDEMKTPIHLVIGQEAAAVGCCAPLRATDQIYLSHRTHGAYLAKGGDLKAMLSEMHCRGNGCAGSRGGSMHLIDKAAGVAGTSAIVGGAVPIAAGAALAAQMKGEDRVVIVFLGDAATEEGVTSETLNFAALKQLPLVFFCENNFYSVQSPLSARQPPRAISRWAEAHGVTGVVGDGMNVLDVYEASATAINRARTGGGPTFIEAPVYRFRAHGGAGDDSRTGYRSEQERDSWEVHCPVSMFGDYLRRRGLIGSESLGAMERAIASELREAFEFALASPNPTAHDLYSHIYAD
jgi:pyruvate dehydrogenase E1 component alpha subunit